MLSENPESVLDISHIDKKLTEEFGKDVCIYEHTCVSAAIKAGRNRRQKKNEQFGELEWKEIFK